MVSKTVLRWLTVVALVVFSSGLMVPDASAQPTQITSCPTTITAAGSFIVKSNLSSTGDCIIVHHSNVSIDMNGKTLTGNGTGGGITDGGVFVQSIAISNGKIKNFNEGIDFSGSNSDLITLERINALSNTDDGIFIQGCCNSLTQIKANNNGGAGVFVNGGNDVLTDIEAISNGDVGVAALDCCSTVSSVTASNNKDDGVDVQGCCSSANNILSTGNGGDGIFMDSCCNGVFFAEADNNTGAGIDILSDDNQVTSCVANGNGGDGIEFASDTNEVNLCKANGNTGTGIDLGNGTFNTVTHVTANHNTIGVALLCNTGAEGNAVRVTAKNNSTANLSETGTGTCTNLANVAP